MKSHFFAYIARMRYITRWALMRNTFPKTCRSTATWSRCSRTRSR